MSHYVALSAVFECGRVTKGRRGFRGRASPNLIACYDRARDMCSRRRHDSCSIRVVQVGSATAQAAIAVQRRHFALSTTSSETLSLYWRDTVSFRLTSHSCISTGPTPPYNYCAASLWCTRAAHVLRTLAGLVSQTGQLCTVQRRARQAFLQY